MTLPEKKVIFALDVPVYDAHAHDLLTSIKPYIGAVKIGMELFLSQGMNVVETIRGRTQLPIMLDLKLHDIPETVERTILRAGIHGITFLTLHIQQKETIERAVAAAKEAGIQLLGVTVLTSMTQDDCRALLCQSAYASRAFDPEARAIQLAWQAEQWGLNGFVCSPKEVRQLREENPTAVLVTPGIRPVGIAAGDQKRTGTPAQAIRDGADFLVVGRPIRDAEDPIWVAANIAEEVRKAQVPCAEASNG